MLLLQLLMLLQLLLQRVLRGDMDEGTLRGSHDSRVSAYDSVGAEPRAAVRRHTSHSGGHHSRPNSNSHHIAHSSVTVRHQHVGGVGSLRSHCGGWDHTSPGASSDGCNGAGCDPDSRQTVRRRSQRRRAGRRSGTGYRWHSGSREGGRGSEGAGSAVHHGMKSLAHGQQFILGHETRHAFFIAQGKAQKLHVATVLRKHAEKSFVVTTVYGRLRSTSRTGRSATDHEFVGETLGMLRGGKTVGGRLSGIELSVA